jgi:lipoprotein-anchoring transpeptidase ErfK/SrfK
MRARLLAALLTASALMTAGAASAQATSTTSPDSSSSTVVESSTTTTESSTTTTVPGDDAVLPDTVPPVPIDAAGSAAGAASRTGTTMVIGDTLPPPPPEEALPESSGTGRRVVYSNSAMRVWAVEEDGSVVKTHRVSGKEGMPSPGEYSVWSRSLYTYSAGNPNIRWQYMVRFAWTPRGGNIGFHEIPRDCGQPGCPLMQTDDQLGEALSGGCVRQSRDDAIWMWEWAQLGTKVVVLP